jgi:hypothetical protein
VPIKFGLPLPNYILKRLFWDDGVTQVVEHLPSKCEALSLNPSTTKKKRLF